MTRSDIFAVIIAIVIIVLGILAVGMVVFLIYSGLRNLFAKTKYSPAVVERKRELNHGYAREPEYDLYDPESQVSPFRSLLEYISEHTNLP